MNSAYDFLIIGGGVNGTSIAMHLAKMGIGSVAVLEKKGLATGATGRSGASGNRHRRQVEFTSSYRDRGRGHWA